MNPFYIFCQSACVEGCVFVIFSCIKILVAIIWKVIAKGQTAYSTANFLAIQPQKENVSRRYAESDREVTRQRGEENWVADEFYDVYTIYMHKCSLAANCKYKMVASSYSPFLPQKGLFCHCQNLENPSMFIFLLASSRALACAGVSSSAVACAAIHYFVFQKMVEHKFR